jgi:hypothetical protein
VNEKLLEIWIRLRRKIDQIVLVALGVLLGLTLMFRWMEQQAPAPARVEPQKPPIPTSTPASWIAFGERFNHPQNPDMAPGVNTLLAINIFEERSAINLTNLMNRLNQRCGDAKKAFDAGDLTTADTIVREIMLQMPSHPGAVELRRQIDAKRAAATPVAPALSPTPAK